MDLETFLIAVYCLTDDFLAGQKLRQRGPQPTLCDSEVLTMEIAGEFLGIDTDLGLFRYFRRHHALLFPKLQRVHRTTFARQAANLWAIKRALWEHLLRTVEHAPWLVVLDSLPVPVCRFARATFCRRLRDVSSYGHDSVARQTFFGMRAHVRISWPGVISAFDLTPANVSDPAMAPEILEDVRGWALGDRAYWSPALREELAAQTLRLLAPFRSRKRETEPWPFWLLIKRRRIETVIAQLVGRFQLARVWARDRWHLCSRMLRKVLSHTVALLFCQCAGLPPLHFDALLDS
ncbi:MAG TPA: IS982 family transposase, partial [Longimicrobiaceae bacterium]|jgi:hypothetical protein|nr:IS982 family transposase [Longimicrobiaceae bacterium]